MELAYSKSILKIKNNKVIRLLCMPFINIKRLLELFLYKYSFEAKKIQKVRNSHVGERCFIIGNGPSLTIDDLERLKKEFCFGANRIFSVFKKTEWRPSAYVCVDRESFRLYSDEIAKLEKCDIFLELFGKKYFRDKQFDYIYSYAPFNINYHINPKFSEDVSQGIYSGQTVTFASIQLAVYMGFKEIYLIGVDNSYIKTIDEKGNVTVDISKRDYSNIIADTGLGVNYVDGTRKAYKIAKEYCDSKGIGIFNATRGGELEVFKRVSLEEVLID